MTKYIVAILVFIALLAGTLLYVGDDAMLEITSSSAAGIFNFGAVKVKWQFAIVIMTLGVIGLLMLWSLLSWVFRLPGRLKSGVGMRRSAQALDAMEEALLAGAEGDASRARKKAEKARSLISSAALGRMVSAHAAESSGDSAEAISQYMALLEDERTDSVGRRGLAQQYLTTGNLSGAIEHAGAEYSENKHARWAFEILLQAQLSDYRWKDAIATLETGLSRKHIEKDVARRRIAVLDTAIATKFEDESNMAGAIDMAQRAISSAPGFAPAAALLARLLGKEGEQKKAISVLEKAWGRAPHPALSAAFLDLIETESDNGRSKRVAHFIKQNPEHRESLLLKVEENLRSGDAVTAWSMLSPMVKDGEATARLCLLAAEAETMLSNETDAKVWALRAATAAVEPDWADLDPEGDAFDDVDQDWRRLVHSFGEKGELIHPRFEIGAARQGVITDSKAKTSEKSASDILEGDAGLARQPDDPGVDKDVDTDDLAMRLDNLLGDKPKS